MTSMFCDKKVLVLGGGVSGTGVATVLAKQGATVVLSDSRMTKAIHAVKAELDNAGVQILTGEQSEDLLTGVDYMVLSPGIPLHSALPKRAEEMGINVISEVEVAWKLTRVPIIAITGTNGKTTTTTLTGELLAESGFNTVVGGNIGAALSAEVAANSKADVVVAEISSYQMEASKEFCPHIAALLNITPDHLERHGSMKEYFKAKAKLFARQSPRQYLVLNYDDALLRKLSQADIRAKIVWFSRKQVLDSGIYVQDGQITIDIDGKKIELMAVSELKLVGLHNVENVLAAVACAYLYGANLTAMRRVLAEFRGVEHRIEYVGVIDGVEYYNDSKSTNPESTIPALRSFKQRIILLAGGRDKNTPLDELMRLVREKNTTLILYGEAAARFGEAATAAGVEKIYMAAGIEEATGIARKTAVSGDIVLLSPACASFDQYENFEERGRHFKRLFAEMG